MGCGVPISVEFVGAGGRVEGVCVASAPGVGADVGARVGTADGLLVGDGIGELVAFVEDVLRALPSNTTAA